MIAARILGVSSLLPGRPVDTEEVSRLAYPGREVHVVNTGMAANVDQSGAIRSGQATLTLRDGANTQVYSGDLRNTGTFLSSSGGSGTWRIEVRLTDVTGTLNFRVQKRS